MAEFVGGVFLGAAVNELLTGLIDVVKSFKRSKKSLSSLESRLERLKPIVKEFAYVQSEDAHPAGKWLRDLQQELEKAYKLVSTLSRGGNFKLILRSGELGEINDRISDLLVDGSMLSPVRVERKVTEVQREVIELQREVRRGFEYPSHLRNKEIKRSTYHLDCAHHMNSIGDGGSSSSTAVPVESRWSRACDIPDPPLVTFGGTAVADTVIENILHGKYKKWIVMWGMGGIGKTFTANTVFNNASIKRHFTGGRFWVTVSKDRPPALLLLRLLCEKIEGRRISSKFPDNLEGARERVRASLDKNRVLLVLDDVWEPATLEYLDVIPEKKEGVILITTRDKGSLKSVSASGGSKYLKRIVDCAEIVRIQQLSVDDSWQLFSWHAFDVFKKPVPSDLEAVAKEVAQECDGLPLALGVIGSTMGHKHVFSSDTILGVTLRKVWEKALHELRSVSKSKDEYKQLYSKLQWSVDNLDDQDPRLKECFYYFGAYAEDYHVPVKELVTIWAGEGLCGEEEAGSLLGFLVAKSVVELVDGGESCKIHDVMRDLVHQTLNFDPKHGNDVSQKKSLYAPAISSSVFPDDWKTFRTPFSVTRLSFQNNRLTALPDEFNAPDLQVLMLGDNYLQNLSPSFFQHFSKLRVLVLRKSGFAEVTGSVLRNLKSLVVLDLSECPSLLMISDELDNLQTLQTIFLHGCKRLQWLPQMKSLTKLHTLSVSLPVLSSTENVCFSDSPILAIFRLGRLRRRMSRYKLDQVLQMATLRRLSIDVKEGPLPPVASLSALEELRIDSTPGISGLMDLRHLKVLQMNKFLGDSVPALDELPFLEELSIANSCKIVSFPESFGRNGAFPSLRKLNLRGNRSLRHFFTFQTRTMPMIEKLSLDIPDLGDVPDTVRALSTLKCFWLYGKVKEANLDQLLRRPDCFLNLEYLSVHQLVGTSGAWTLPQHLLERETLGMLKVEISTL